MSETQKKSSIGHQKYKKIIPAWWFSGSLILADCGGYY
jgi:hypothetical protein